MWRVFHVTVTQWARSHKSVKISEASAIAVLTLPAGGVTLASEGQLHWTDKDVEVISGIYEYYKSSANVLKICSIIVAFGEASVSAGN